MTEQEIRDRLDAADTSRCLDFVNEPKRCPGGRLVLDGYICPHCSADYTDDGDPICREPADEIVRKQLARQKQAAPERGDSLSPTAPAPRPAQTRAFVRMATESAGAYEVRMVEKAAAIRAALAALNSAGLGSEQFAQPIHDADHAAQKIVSALRVARMVDESKRSAT